MYTQIADFVVNVWKTGRKTKHNINGWISGNAVCCQHNGESPDNRNRGGVITNMDGTVSYSCFNCNFKAHYSPGYTLSTDFRRLLRWMGASDIEIERTILESYRIKQQIDPFDIQPIKRNVDFKPSFPPIKLPDTFISFDETKQLLLDSPDDVPQCGLDAIGYAFDRKLNIDKYKFYWDASTEFKNANRLIVPFYWDDNIVGYTGRAFDDNKVKYLNNMPQNFVFNINNQLEKSDFVIVTEGIFDAISIDGVAIMHNTVNEQQAKCVESLGKNIIVVPDFDDGPGTKLIHDALERDWTVSFPIWHETCKDINEAVCKYGKLFVLKSIVDAVETSKLKIRLKTKTIYGSGYEARQNYY